MSLNKYPCIFSRQMEATVSINLIIFLQRAGKIFTINLLLFFFFFARGMFTLYCSLIRLYEQTNISFIQ